MMNKLLAAAALAAVTLLPATRAEAHLSGIIYSPVYRHIASYDCTGIFDDVGILSTETGKFVCDATVTEFDVLCEDDQGNTQRLEQTGQCIQQWAKDYLTEDDVVCTGGTPPRDLFYTCDMHTRRDHQGSDGCVELCHIPPGNPGNAHTICVSPRAVRSHTRHHGDTLGACAPPEPQQCLASETVPLPQTVYWEAQALCDALGPTWNVVDELVQTVQVRLTSYECTDATCVMAFPSYESVLDCTLPAGWDIETNPPPGGGVPTDYNCTLVAADHCDAGGVCPIPLPNVCGP